MKIADLKEDSRRQRKQPRIGNRKLKSLENTANRNVDIISVFENFLKKKKSIKMNLNFLNILDGKHNFFSERKLFAKAEEVSQIEQWSVEENKIISTISTEEARTRHVKRINLHPEEGTFATKY